MNEPRRIRCQPTLPSVNPANRAMRRARRRTAGETDRDSLRAITRHRCDSYTQATIACAFGQIFSGPKTPLVPGTSVGLPTHLNGADVGDHGPDDGVDQGFRQIVAHALYR